MFEDRTLIIAEAGVNHNGSLELALQLIDSAADCGADVVKFQTFTADQIATPGVEMAAYQKKNTGIIESQYQMLKKLELPREFYPKLIERCWRNNIGFMSSIFDHGDAGFLDSLKMPYFKIPSGEIINGPLLLEVAKTQTPIILSTGMATLGEVEQALMVIAFGYLHPAKSPSLQAFQRNWASREARDAVHKNVTLLHCTSNYPAAPDSINLRVLDTLAQAFRTRIGYSDHTLGDTLAVAAVAKGARVIEKHFTMDKNLPGPDHKASMGPAEFKVMVEKIRQIEIALGSEVKHRTAAEEDTAKVARKSLIAAEDIPAGALFSASNIGIKRAGDGLSVTHYWDILGKKANVPYKKGSRIE